ncbi:MAG: PmeII family type II restriction endonuclease [Anaerolineales bacterium]
MTLQVSDVITYVENHIGGFHSRRLQNLQALKLPNILKRKNPYLFRAKNILTGAEFVKILLDAHLSSQEETIFGEFLEGLAIFVCRKVYNGRKSAAEGIDLEFEKDSISYVVSIKSGPNWGNSRQISKMKDDFKKVKRILTTSGGIREVVAVNGCCYGRDNNPNKGDYFKLCGQAFWEFVSGDPNFYIEIIEPLGHQARQRNEEFNQAYANIINRFTTEFSKDFYTEANAIDWEKLVKFTSSKKTM